MEFVLHPWHLLVLTLSALMNREQENAIEYLKTENQVLREKLGKGRIMLTDFLRVVGVCGVAGLAWADDGWSKRGHGLPLRWSETENVAWKTAIHDLGHST